MPVIRWRALLLLGCPAFTPLAAQVPAQTVPAGAMRIAEIVVSGDDHPAADPRWTPTRDAGLVLDHRPAEALDAAWIRRQFAANAMIGDGIGFDRIAALVQRINAAFLQNGYINSGVVIAPQAADAALGRLRLRLVIGHIAAPADGADPVAVVWADGKRRGLNADYVRDRMASARAAPLNVNALERDFRLLADDPAIRTVTAELRPGTAQGEASLALTVDPQPRYDVYTGFGNSRSPSVGGQRGWIGGTVRNMLSAGDLLSAEYGITRGLTDLTASYATPIVAPGISLQISGGFNNAAVVDRPLVPLDIHSREYFVEGGLRATILAEPLLPAGERWHAARSASLSALVVHRRVIATLLGERFSFSPGAVDGRTEYSALRVGGDFSRRSPNAVLALSLVATLGLAGTRPAIPGLIHPSEHFTAALLQANYARRLDAHGLELRLRFAGQASGGLLYSPERLTVGGAYTVRGYRENLLLADEGLAGSAEIAHPVDLLRPHGDARWGHFNLAAFVDGALVHNRRDPQPLPTSIASIGGSIEWAPAPWLSASLIAARALRHVRATGSRDTQDRGYAFRIVLHPIAAARALF